MDIMQVMRDRRWLADPDSVEQIDDALRVAVFQPIARAIEGATPIKDAGDASQLFVHMVGVRRPGYGRAGSIDPVSAEEIVDLFLSGVHGGTRAAVQTAFERAREPGAPIEVK
jgi:hypothetical protein